MSSTAVAAKPSKPSWHARLSRVTSGGRLLPELEVLRFYSLFLIVLFHLNFEFSHSVAGIAPSARFDRELDRYAFHALFLFFTISGFIISTPFARAYLNREGTPSLKAFYWRRVTRIEPPYIVSLALLSIYALAVGSMTVADWFAHFLASLTYTHNLTYGYNSAINVVAWSLEVEVQFYLIAPLLCQVFRIRSARLRRAVLVGGILFAGWLGLIHLDGARIWSQSLLRYLHFFLAGLLFCDIYIADFNESPAKSRRFDLVFLAGLAAIILAARTAFGSFLIFPLATVAYYAGVFRGKFFSRFFTVRSFGVVGGMCYSIYLYHANIISFLGRRGVFSLHVGNSYLLSLALQMIIMSTIVVAICGVMFVLFERPCMVRDWPQRLIARWLRDNKKAASAEAAAWLK
jgi:peptidoglycan/LPS O-acetylase OafA/YrhL